MDCNHNEDVFLLQSTNGCSLAITNVLRVFSGVLWELQ